MSGYNINHIIEECIQEKSRNLAPEAKRDNYQETWAALNEWLLQRMKQQKGGEVGFLGTFGWEIQQGENKEISTRPIFLIADSFVKDFNVKRQRVHYRPKTTKIQVINYSQLAIKYTQNLTKDMVFSGVRDIVRKIGSFVQRGATLDVAFTFGTLRVKECKVKFDFDPSALGSAAADKEDLEAALKEFEEDVLMDEDEEAQVEAEIAQKEAAAAALSKVPALTLPTPESKDEEKESSEEYKMDERPEMGYDGNDDDKYFDEYYGPEPGQDPDATLHDILMNMGPVSPQTRRQRTQAAREAVANEAFARCLTVAEQNARAEELTSEYGKKQLQDWRQAEVAKREQAHREMLESQRILDGQIEDYEGKMRTESENRRAGKIQYKLPGTVPDHLLKHGPPKTKKEMQKELFDTLGYMIRSNEQKARQDREDRIQEEKQYLDHVAMEIDLNSALDRAKHLQTQKDLLEAWEKDSHIRNIEKLRNAGRTQAVSSYISDNFVVPTRETDINGRITGIPSSTGTLRSSRPGSGTKMKGFGGASVGFDSRK